MISIVQVSTLAHFNHMRALDRSFCLYSLILGLFGDIHLHNFDLPKDAAGGGHGLF